ncbi:SAM-dependent methyltransferase [Neobacillus sp. OS1-2]|uniref:class I SAM-dependent methyltransferase n=1 Tax=Neobacillus sp. OS1-2 TaxID=3070680 RepID=UPI0027DEEF59|nr:SAM-dependent methyltransferase [Neobacillus sp. OS1-2]WML40550.1 SAM-dependent methyltransferase [Neobacillus sp. OS1-2]
MITYLQKLISNSKNGFITYADYMEAVLYHPKFGYYMKEKQKIGRQGDFITTSNISDVYGRLVAKWFSHICQTTSLPAVFCEIGAGNGRFAKAFLQEWNDSIKTSLQYIIVESSPYHLKLQQEMLLPEHSVVQVGSLSEIDHFEGMIFSNELFDALPVHVIEKIDGKLFEVMVGAENNGLYEMKLPLTNPEILSFLEVGKINLKEKQRIEIPLPMEKVIQEIATVLTKGIVVTADYGYTNDEWMDPRRAEGSLRGYYQHTMIHDVLQHPGEMDITTHIHFDSLIQKGAQEGLHLLTKLRQDEFLLKAGILKELENHYDPNPFSEVSKRNRAIRSLVMPSGMSSYFHIIVQQKGLQLSESDLFTE